MSVSVLNNHLGSVLYNSLSVFCFCVFFTRFFFFGGIYRSDSHYISTQSCAALLCVFDESKLYGYLFCH